MKTTFKLLSEDHQFYLKDHSVVAVPAFMIESIDVRNRVKTLGRVLVIQPDRDGQITVDLDIADSEPAVDLAHYPHIVETRMEIISDRLDVEECTGDIVCSVSINPGHYRVRVGFAGELGAGSIGMSRDDCYWIVLWPADAGETTDLKVAIVRS